MPQGTQTHELQLLSLCSTAHEPQEKPSQWEARMPQLKNSPHSLQLEKACVQQQRPSTATNKQMNNKKYRPEDSKTSWGFSMS